MDQIGNNGTDRRQSVTARDSGPAEAAALAAAKRHFLEALPCDADLWVFAYGSLLWKPGFAVLESRQAVLHGYHRRFCIYSTHHRGAPDRPGLVLGLDRGGSCRGMALRIACREVPAVMSYLWDREMVTAVYRPRRVGTAIYEPAGTAARMTCHTFVVDPSHRQYAGRLSTEETVRLIRQGHGIGGPNTDYLLNTVAHLREIGIADPGLERLAKLVREGDNADARSKTNRSE